MDGLIDLYDCLSDETALQFLAFAETLLPSKTHGKPIFADLVTLDFTITPAADFYPPPPAKPPPGHH